MASAQEIVDRFPAFATILGIPEIADLITLASAPGQNWSPAFFQEQLWNSAWWKKTPEPTRLWEARKLVDPATAGEQSRQMAANVVGIAGSLGVHLTAAEVALYSEFAAQNGWDDKALTRHLIDEAPRRRVHAGSLTATQDSLRATAGNYAVPLSDSTLFDWSKRIQSGRMTTDGFESFIRGRAKATFPSLNDEIDAGFTVRQVADPYLQVASKLLGRPAEQMELTDPKWQRALQSRDKDGKIVGPQTTLDWQRTLMTDPVYGYDRTEHGKLAALQLRDSLGKTFGLSA